MERLHLKPLPAWIPEVYRVHQRLVDTEGYVALHTNRYSVPVHWIGRRVEVRETRDKIAIQLDARNLVTHTRIAEAEHQRVLLAEHRPPRGQGLARTQPHPEEKAILAAAPEMADVCGGGEAAEPQSAWSCPAAITEAGARVSTGAAAGRRCAEAARYGLYDLDRLERMILRRVARDYFLLDDREPEGMIEELEQLLKNLKLRRMLEVYDEQLRAAEKDDVTLLGVRRAPGARAVACAAGGRAGVAHPARQSAGALVAGDVSLRRASRASTANRSHGFAELDFIAKAENIVLVGPTGVGKTGLACGLLLKALQNGYRCQFIRAQDLFDEMYASLADRSTRQLLNASGAPGLSC